MNTPSKLTGRRNDLIFLFFLGFSIFFYLYNITFSDIWVDESFSMALVGHSFSEMAGLIGNDFHPPLYFYGLKLFTGITGISDFTIRLFSVLGVLSTMILGYAVGQKVFGKKGALYFCLLLLSLPMLAVYSHIARMYTWAAFSVTGVFFYAYFFLVSNRKSDLVLLGLFSVMAAYTHYFGLVAAGGANIFVLARLILQKNRAWRMHLIGSAIAVVLYLPWLYFLFTQARQVKKGFWVPPLSWWRILSCFTDPFGEGFWLDNTSYVLIAIVYVLTAVVIWRSFRRKTIHEPVLGLSLFIFCFTVTTTAIISLFFKPVLYSRYIMSVVTMLMVPPTLFFIVNTNQWLKGILLGLLLTCGVYVSISASSFSFGPYRQTMEFMAGEHPNIRKMVHIFEATPGSMMDYDAPARMEHYWFSTAKTTVYTNLDVYDRLHKITTLEGSFDKGELFSMVGFEALPFNQESFDEIASQASFVKIDTVVDRKAKYRSTLLVYIFKYK